MAKLVTLLIALLGFLFSDAAFSGTQIQRVYIKDLIVNVDTGIHFRTQETMINPDVCSLGSWYKIESGGAYEKEAYAMLLAKKAQDQAMDFCLYLAL